jgi:hypothetical protein
VCDLIPVVEDSPGTASHAIRGQDYHARHGWFGRTPTPRTLDPQRRGASVVEKVSPAIIDEVIAKLLTLLE